MAGWERLTGWRIIWAWRSPPVFKTPHDGLSPPPTLGPFSCGPRQNLGSANVGQQLLERPIIIVVHYKWDDPLGL